MVLGVGRIGNPTYIWRLTTPIPNEPIDTDSLSVKIREIRG
jgi:hypothetical protein